MKERIPEALLCTNLYGESMELYRDGFLKIPPDVIRIFSDNGYGRMVSRRKGNEDPRIPSLPEGNRCRAGGGIAAAEEPFGLYYHASFYDLQAASHITMLPNSLCFVSQELGEALSRGGDAYWLVNCSNVKPHSYILGYIAALWKNGAMEPERYSLHYAETYYGAEQALSVSEDLLQYAEEAVSYDPYADNHAGDQFYHHVPRMLVTQFLRDRSLPAAELRWLSDRDTLEEQTEAVSAIYREAAERYAAYQDRCLGTFLSLRGAHRKLYEDSVLLQARLYRLWSAGALMSYARALGEGPHYYAWMREFMDSEEDRRDMLILNTERHPEDEELFRYMRSRWES